MLLPIGLLQLTTTVGPWSCRIISSILLLCCRCADNCDNDVEDVDNLIKHRIRPNAKFLSRLIVGLERTNAKMTVAGPPVSSHTNFVAQAPEHDEASLKRKLP